MSGNDKPESLATFSFQEARVLKSNFEKSGRRDFMLASATALAGFAVARQLRPETAAGKPLPGVRTKMVRIVEFSDKGVREGLVTVPKIVKSDAEWRKQLTPIEFDVTRRAGTEMAFSGAYWKLHEKGLFRCICCSTALYSSDTKFESGTGWPSFWEPIARENIEQIGDNSLGLSRTAISCRRCDAHLGHVFDDGPKPTGLRYCMNSAALHFVRLA